MRPVAVVLASLLLASPVWASSGKGARVPQKAARTVGAAKASRATTTAPAVRTSLKLQRSSAAAGFAELAGTLLPKEPSFTRHKDGRVTPDLPRLELSRTTRGPLAYILHGGKHSFTLPRGHELEGLSALVQKAGIAEGQATRMAKDLLERSDKAGMRGAPLLFPAGETVEFPVRFPK